MSALDDLRKIREDKLELLKKANLNPFPERSSFNLVKIETILKDFNKFIRSKKKIGVAGRLMAKREHGGSIFIDIGSDGNKIQVFISKDIIGEASFNLFRSSIDIGDFVGFIGKAFSTKRTEPTIGAEKWEVLTKTLLPLPEKWHGLSDTEERFRKRYLDILMNSDVRQRLMKRSKIVKELRGILDKAGFLEIETPILQPIYGGALAEPFKTHHRMLDMDMYLRIAPELYLKRLLVAGFERVFEIGRNFRNEGIDMTHNPEFTTVELYAAYWNAERLKIFISETLHDLIKKLNKKPSFQFDNHLIEFPKRVPSIAFWTVIERHALITHPEKLSRAEMELSAKRFGLEPKPYESKEKIANEIFSKICRPKLIQPTFMINHPLEISPLAKKLSENPKLVDRFQLIIGGVEVANGWTELNDPIDERQRMEAHEEMRKAGEKEAEPLDNDFIEALEYGMPPAAGVGISIDRITMLLTNTKNIKEVIAFPTLKSKK